MFPVAIDIECTTFQKGNPFARRNRLCYVGAYRQGSPILLGSDDIVPLVRQEIVSAPRVVGFNIKFDIHWLRRYGIDLDCYRGIWDLQLGHFLLGGQKTPYPSLEDACERYGLPGKDDTLERKYGWPGGAVDTPDIPREETLHYLQIDLEQTMQVYHHQMEEFKHNVQLYKLFQLQCKDLLVLAEMEWNGLMADTKTAQSRAEELQSEIAEIESQLNQYSPNVVINWDSTDHLSRVLYGGTIEVTTREITGFYKSGAKVGEPRYRIVTNEVVLPRLFEPLPRSQLKKEGYYSTDEPTLRQLKPKSLIIDLLMERSRLVKIKETLVGTNKIIEQMDWPDGEIHGQLNQCVAQTGRLSASKPNQQNWDENVKQLIRTRYDE